MALGFGLVLILALVLAQLRRITPPPRRRRCPRGSPLEWGLAAVTLLALHNPLFSVLTSGRTIVGGDTPSHCFIAESVVRHGFAHGWVDTVNGGFPLGLHYPLSSTFAIGTLVALGVPSGKAAMWVGVGALVVTPLLVLRLGRGLGLSPSAALVTATLVGLVAPHNCFMGGWESVFVMGVMAQVLAIPFVVLVVQAVACPGPRFAGPVFGALLVMAHPQVALAALAVIGAGALVAGDRATLVRYLRVGVAAGVVALAVFGPGLVTLDVPFGWPPILAKRRLGYAPIVFRQTLFAGAWFDRGRAEIATYAGFFALAWHLGMANRRASRVALAAAAAVALGSVSGYTIASWGWIGDVLLSFVQPLRVTALMPLALGLLVGLAWNDAERFAVRGWRLLGRHLPGTISKKLRRTLPKVTALAAAAAFCIALYPDRQAWMMAAPRLRFRGDGSPIDCGPVRSADLQAMSTWVTSITGGRLEFSDSLTSCLNSTGVLYRSTAPLGQALGVGAHVGIMTAAFGSFDASRPTAAAEAEALGIRYYLHRHDEPPPPDDPAWERTHATDAVVLSTRRGGTDLVGLGCIETRWSGSDAALRSALLEDLQGPRQVLVPDSLIELQETSGSLVRTPVARRGCDSSRATVSATRDEVGEYRVRVTSAAPVDVVFRVSAFPTWRLTVNGTVVPGAEVVKTAPGFVATRVPPGTHELIATVSPPRFYLLGILAAWLVVAALSVRWGSWRRHAPVTSTE